MGAAGGLIRDLVELHRRSETGVLEVHHGEARIFVYLDAGVPIFAEHGTLGDTLGRLMMRLGRLSAEQHATVIRVMTEQLVENEQTRFGEVAVELGFLDRDQVEEALAAQVKQKVLTCLQWESPVYLFHRDPDAVKGVRRFPVEVEPLVSSALGLFYDAERVSRIVSPVEAGYPRLLWSARELEERLDLAPEEIRFASSLDGAHRLEHVLHRCRLPVSDASRIAATLLLVEALEMTDHPSARTSRSPSSDVGYAPPDKTRTPPPGEDLETRSSRPPSDRVPVPLDPTRSPDATAAGARSARAAGAAHGGGAGAAARGARKQATGAPGRDPSRRRLKRRRIPLLEQMARRKRKRGVVEDEAKKRERAKAFAEGMAQSLRGAARKPESKGASPRDSQETRLTAELAVQAGRAAMSAANWGRAIAEFERAQTLDPEPGEYQLYLDWARHMSHPSREARPQLLRAAAALIRADPHFGFAFYVLGSIRMDDEEYEKAEKALKRALQLDPELGDAERRLRLLQMRMPKRRR